MNGAKFTLILTVIRPLDFLTKSNDVFGFIGYFRVIDDDVQSGVRSDSEGLVMIAALNLTCYFVHVSAFR